MKNTVKLEISLHILAEIVRSLDLPQKYELVEILQQAIADDEKYNPLQDLLTAERWREADEETAKILWNLSGSKIPGFISGAALEKISCEELKTIDKLWVEFSNGKFGFSVQERIWQDLGGVVYDPKQNKFHMRVGNRFSRQVGWLKSGTWIYAHADFNFTIDASPGHLPSFWCVGALGGIGNAIQRYHRFLLASKLTSCDNHATLNASKQHPNSRNAGAGRGAQGGSKANDGVIQAALSS